MGEVAGLDEGGDDGGGHAGQRWGQRCGLWLVVEGWQYI